MIEVNGHTLENGLRLLHHKDATTKMVALNLLYKVGARNETVGKTGFAHLFEHLMFSGSENVPSFDEALQRAGGESNAWTSSDITNYYDVLPAHNAETAFWIESDRLLSLSLNQKSLDAQKSVVVEEYKQRCLNRPYGDLSHYIRKTAFREHPYRWPVLGVDVEEIANATLESAQDFYHSHYSPDNLIMCVSGNISFEETVAFAEKWFGDIPARSVISPVIPQEPAQTSPQKLNVRKDVPHNLIVKAYHMCGRTDKRYHTTDIISDVLANGNSARFFQNVLMQTDVFSDLDATIEGSYDPGLMIVKGRLREGTTFQDGEAVIEAELDDFLKNGATQDVITKYVNKLDSKECFENISYLEKASKLCYFEMLSKAKDINSEIELYREITPEYLKTVANEIFRADNCTTIHYGPDA